MLLERRVQLAASPERSPLSNTPTATPSRRTSSSRTAPHASSSRPPAAPSRAPHFFHGRLTTPRRAADLLLAVSEVAATRFFIPAATLARILREADPVVTSGGERLRFEFFSACYGVYARCDLRPEAADGEWLRHGTTNVDFGPHMRGVLPMPPQHP